MSNQSVSNSQAQRSGKSGPASPVWWLVLKQEFTDLWMGGRVFVLLIIFSLLMSITSVLNEVESELSSIPPAEMVFLTLVGSLSFGLLIGLILGADSISGERDRVTLEALLLTPASRRQIVLGKFLAALSPWPVALLLSIPYMAVLSRGHETFGQGVVVGALLGTVLAAAFTAFGMLTSIWSKSNKVSLLVCLLVYVIFLIPTQFPGGAHKGDWGYFVQKLNPIQGTSGFIEKFLVNNRTLAEMSDYLVAATVSSVIVLGLLFLYAAPRLNLEGGMPPLTSRKSKRAASSLTSTGAALLLALPLVMAAQTAPATDIDQDLRITVDLGYKTVNAGGQIEFKTVATNHGAEKSPPLNMAMNIVLVGKGDPVDPEDWSPQRTQQVESLAPGESVEQSWAVEAILAGEYIVYLTIIPKPKGPEATSQPVSSPGIHLTVRPFANTNPGGVLPVAIGMPLGLIAVSLLSRRSKRWRRATNADGSKTNV